MYPIRRTGEKPLLVDFHGSALPHRTGYCAYIFEASMGAFTMYVEVAFATKSSSVICPRRKLGELVISLLFLDFVRAHRHLLAVDENLTAYLCILQAYLRAVASIRVSA
jgi:hypothetical protein